MIKKADGFNSINVQKPISRVDVRKLVFSTTQVRGIAPKVTPIIELSKEAHVTHNIPDLMFTNCLPISDEGAIPSHVERAFEVIGENSSVLANGIKPIRFTGEHETRIRDILLKYLDPQDLSAMSDYLYKSDVRESSLTNSRGSFRVVTLYKIEPRTHKKQRHSKHKLIILFFDPYHLFIPSKDFGTHVYTDVSMYSSDCKKMIEKYMSSK